MRFFIPTIGTSFTLEQAWGFTLHKEYRNDALWGAFDAENHPSLSEHWVRVAAIQAEMSEIDARLISETGHVKFRSKADRDRYYHLRDSLRAPLTIPAELPAETSMRIDRIFIRKAMADFDSVSLYVVDSPDKRFVPKRSKGFLTGQARFWVKLNDFNTIHAVNIKEPNRT